MTLENAVKAGELAKEIIKVQSFVNQLEKSANEETISGLYIVFSNNDKIDIKAEFSKDTTNIIINSILESRKQRIEYLTKLLNDLQ